MKTLSIDIESFSSVDLTKSGVYRYAESDDFEILLFGYSADGGPVHVVDLASGEQLPADIVAALTDPSVTKWAYNAQFERVCLTRFLGLPTGEYLDPSSWRCTMVWAATLGLPLSLEGVGAVLGLKKQKLKEGKDLIRFFCQPCAPTNSNGQRLRNLPEHAPEKWALFKAYNRRDVETELAIQARLAKFPVPDSLWEEYVLDQQINDRGIALDMTLVRQAIRCDEQFKQAHLDIAREVTGLENPNSPTQLKAWLAEQGVEADSLSKAAVLTLLEKAEGSVELALSLRQDLAKSSVKKYAAMENVVCRDGRARGLLQFYGANRSGRYAGRLIQVQNLPVNRLPDLEVARQLIYEGQFETAEMLYESVPIVLSELIRTAFIPRPGHRFFVADFSAIEARVIAWMAGEQWRLDVFKNGGDIYCASASQMFHVSVEKHGVNGHLRQKGKIAELACIAEGSLVLTDSGLVPIERVESGMRLWDGDAWVAHDGVVYNGIKKVIEYQGLRATPDHLVWIEGRSQPVPFGSAASNGARLVRFGETGERMMPLQGLTKIYDIRNAGPRHRFTVSGRLVHNCGYGGGVGALKAMGAVEMGVPESELPDLIQQWRTANPNIVKLWRAVDTAVKTCVKQHTATVTHGIQFVYRSGILFITLPSGRKLAYVKPRIGENRFGGESVTYEGVTSMKKWDRIESFAGKFVENIVQATARDLLAKAMLRLDAAGYRIVMHVHDEVVVEAPVGSSLENICTIMGQVPAWADGMLMRADGFVCDFYKKE